MATTKRGSRKGSLPFTHPRPPLTPSSSSMPPLIANTLPPSAPASPPTPAPSPTPHLGSPSTWRLTPLEDVEDPILEDARQAFARLSPTAKTDWLRSIVDLCDNHTLSFLHHIVSPRLKKDPFKALPNELCFRILEFIDDPKTFVRASQVSRRWREIVSDDQAWKTLCEKHAYRRMSTDSTSSSYNRSALSTSQLLGSHRYSASFDQSHDISLTDEESTHALDSFPADTGNPAKDMRNTRHKRSHRSRFKHAYLVESAWKKSGSMNPRFITDQGVVTSVYLTKKYIVVSLENAKIHVFNTRGAHRRTLTGHVMGVWAMVPWDDILVSGGCDRDVRVWNMATGASVHIMRGHTSTVRCLKMSDAKTAISGSRDTTLRIWNLASGTCANVLTGHRASVRCLEICGDIVVSGSYDTTAKIWRISTGECLRTLEGHFSQIYAIAFDGNRIATGSMDTSVRIWNPNDGQCIAILQGHTSLVGQLQMRHSTLVTGGSDGSVRVWSLDTNLPIHRLAAHDNSVTSLQFDDTRIVSGGSDGRVKIWDMQTGAQIRELSQPADAVWRVAFESERCVVLASRATRTVMEVWDFSPQEEENEFEDEEYEELDDPSGSESRDASMHKSLPRRPQPATQEHLALPSKSSSSKSQRALQKQKTREGSPENGPSSSPIAQTSKARESPDLEMLDVSSDIDLPALSPDFAPAGPTLSRPPNDDAPMLEDHANIFDDVEEEPKSSTHAKSPMRSKAQDNKKKRRSGVVKRRQGRLHRDDDSRRSSGDVSVEDDAAHFSSQGAQDDSEEMTD